jgi:hypothetical protein
VLQCRHCQHGRVSSSSIGRRSSAVHADDSRAVTICSTRIPGSRTARADARAGTSRPRSTGPLPCGAGTRAPTRRCHL